MSSVIRRAAANQRSAMYQLFDRHKQSAFALALQLVGDEKTAADIVVDAFARLWNTVTPTMTETALAKQLTVLTVERCKQHLTRKNSKALRMPQDRRFVLPPSTVVTDNGGEPLDVVKDHFSTLQWTVFVLRTISGLTREEQAAVLKLDGRTLDMAWNAEHENMTLILSRSAHNGISPDEVIAALAKRAADTVVPQEVKNAAEAHIRALAAPQEKANRIKTLKLTAIIIVITAVTLTLCWAAVMSLSGVESDDTLDSTGESVTDTADNTQSNAVGSVTTVADPTHYAEIVIKEHGTVTVALDADIAPKTVANFQKLADEGFYNSLSFHRIMEGFMMQGGDPKSDGTGGSDETIVGEFADNGIDNPLSHVRGAISMARSDDPDSASSQFFIVHEDSTFLDGQYAAFGYVTDGMDIVDTICTSVTPLDDNGTIELGEQPVMETVKVYTAAEYAAKTA